MTWRIRPFALVVAVAAAMSPEMAFAQCPETRAKRPLLVAGGGVEVPLGESGRAGFLIPLSDLEYGDPGCSVPAYRGLLVEAALGVGGRRVSAGFARLVKQNGQPSLFGQDVVVSLVRTGESPRRAAAHSTYVSAEAGLTIIGVRFGVGMARRLTSAESATTILIWSAGARLAW